MTSSAYPTIASNITPGLGSISGPVSKATPKLLTPITSKSVTLNNRIVVPPMCMYSAIDGVMNDFHASHCK